MRALAVTLVIAFHFFPGLAPGGFVGVDIFFVISGYLITRKVVSDKINGTFQLAEFYRRRVLRLFPSLITVLVTTYVVGWLFMYMPSQFQSVGKQIFGSSIFAANFFFFSTISYFEPAAKSSTLLHLWSLGIEEQFYLVWPVLILLLMRNRRILFFGTIVLTAVSFVSYYLTTDVAAKFYLPQNRFWELLIGALVAIAQLLPHIRLKTCFAVSPKPTLARSELPFYNLQQIFEIAERYYGTLGLLGIVVGQILYKTKDNFQGTNFTILSLLSTVLIIASTSNSAAERVVSGRRIVFIGKISYPLYLWHWPIFSFSQILLPKLLSTQFKILLILFTLVLSIATYCFVEKPLKSIRNSVRVLTVAMFVIAAVSAALWQRGVPIPRLTSDESLILENYNYLNGLVDIPDLYTDDAQNQWARENILFAKESQLCFSHYADTEFFKTNSSCLKFKGPKNKRVFLLGDSHAAYLGASLNSVLSPQGFEFRQAQIASFGCQALLFASPDPRCQQILDQQILPAIRLAQPAVILLFANFAGSQKSANDYLDFVRNLKTETNQIIVIGQMPLLTTPLPELILRDYVTHRIDVPFRILNDEPTSLAIEHDMKNAFLNADKKIHYFSLRDLLCNRTGCLTMVGSSLKDDLIVWDYGHMTLNGSLFVSNFLVNRIDNH